MNKFTALAGTGLLLLGSAGFAQNVPAPAPAPADAPAMPPEASMPAGAAAASELPAEPATTTEKWGSADSAAPANGPADAMPAPDTATAAPSPAPETALNDETATDAAFTDQQIKSFASAALEIQNLPGDPAAKQQQAATIVADSGIDAETFNAIGQAMQNNPDVAQRVQLAAATLQGQPEG